MVAPFRMRSDVEEQKTGCANRSSPLGMQSGQSIRWLASANPWADNGAGTPEAGLFRPETVFRDCFGSTKAAWRIPKRRQPATPAEQVSIT
jgi:hypothetical protein